MRLIATKREVYTSGERYEYDEITDEHGRICSRRITNNQRAYEVNKRKVLSPQEIKRMQRKNQITMFNRKIKELAQKREAVMQEQKHDF